MSRRVDLELLIRVPLEKYKFHERVALPSVDDQYPPSAIGVELAINDNA